MASRAAAGAVAAVPMAPAGAPRSFVASGRPARISSPLCMSPSSSQRLASTQARTAVRQRDAGLLAFDDLLRMVPTPGRTLAANDLMFSTDEDGISDPKLLRDYIDQHSDGLPRFMSPIVRDDVQAAKARDSLPLMLYLPGLDGSGICASRQFPYLQQIFDLRKLIIPLNDKTPFPELVRLVQEYLDTELRGAEDRPVYILGESFGGLLALSSTATMGDRIDRVILVNPATSFPRSIWPQFGPVLSQLPEEAYRVAPFALAPLMGDFMKMASFYIPPSASPQDQIELLAESLVSMLPLLGMMSDLLPADTLLWKMSILAEGAEFTRDLYPEVLQPVLVIAGDADQLIPSEEEAAQLCRELPNCTSRILPGYSHILMQEQGVDVAQIIKESGFYITQRRSSQPVASSLPLPVRSSQSTATPIEFFADVAYSVAIAVGRR